MYHRWIYLKRDPTTISQFSNSNWPLHQVCDLRLGRQIDIGKLYESAKHRWRGILYRENELFIWRNVIFTWNILSSQCRHTHVHSEAATRFEGQQNKFLFSSRIHMHWEFWHDHFQLNRCNGLIWSKATGTVIGMMLRNWDEKWAFREAFFKLP